MSSFSHSLLGCASFEAHRTPALCSCASFQDLSYCGVKVASHPAESPSPRSRRRTERVDPSQEGGQTLTGTLHGKIVWCAMLPPRDQRVVSMLDSYPPVHRGLFSRSRGNSNHGHTHTHTFPENTVGTTLNLWETLFCWYLQGNHHSRVSYVLQDVVHPCVLRMGTLPVRFRATEHLPGMAFRAVQLGFCPRN